MMRSTDSTEVRRRRSLASKSGLFVGFSLLSVLLLLSLFVPVAARVTGVTRERLSFNADWRFQKGDPSGVGDRLSYSRIKEWVTATGSQFQRDHAAAARPSGNPGGDVVFTQRGFDDSGWRRLDLPHDWGIEGPFDQAKPGETGKLPWWGIAWYRKHFTVPAAEKSKRVYLDIDGAMAYAAVWLNGQFVGGWPYGYASFELDLTPYLQYGADNVIAIRLDNPPESSRWYPGGGIYRNVWLVKTSSVHVGHWGAVVTTPEISPAAARVDVQVAVQNDAAAGAPVTLTAAVYRSVDGQIVGPPLASTAPQAAEVAAGSSVDKTLTLRLNKPRLWSTETPALYVAVITVRGRAGVLDRYETVFGVRTIKFDAEKGFLLNGRRIPLNGVCDHHDLGPLGSAINIRALQRQIELLKEMGVNAIRTSHNPPAPELLDLCDQMGIVVMDESFDCWRRAKKPNDYHLLFDDWHEKDFRAQIRRDRNHPCVVLWSIGNEIEEQIRPEGIKIAEELVRIVHEEDPTRPATAACNHTQAGYNGFQKIVDVFGYNYKPGEYGKFRQSNPLIPLIGTETASCISSRGEYFFPVSDDKSKGAADFQVSSYDLSAPPWATSPDTEFHGQDEFAFTGGEFVWTGFDYLGEPTPFGGDSRRMLDFTDSAVRANMARQLADLGKILVPSRSSYFGIIDLCGFKKDRFYLYQARWRPELPMVHILPHWNWPERTGQVTPVHVYTSGDEAELFLNGRSLGRKKRAPLQYRLRWDEVTYEPGELRVVAYKNGKRWAEAATRTTGVAARLALQADRPRIKADGADLAFVTVTVADANGLLVPRSKNQLRFEISGPGEVVAVDNGDATSHEPVRAQEHSAYNGMCLVIVRAKPGKPGVIKLKAVSEGLTAAEMTITARP